MLNAAADMSIGGSVTVIDTKTELVLPINFGARIPLFRPGDGEAGRIMRCAAGDSADFAGLPAPPTSTWNLPSPTRTL